MDTLSVMEPLEPAAISAAAAAMAVGVR